MIMKYLNFILFFTCFNFFVFSQDIFDLARSGTVSQMEELLKKDPEALDRLSNSGFSPFLLACYRGNNEIAKYLMEKGANTSLCTSEGSAIYGIIFKNNTEMLAHILDKGISTNDTCQFKQFGTPLHMAMSLKRYEMVELLLMYGANKSIPNQEGKTIDELLIQYEDEKLSTIFKKFEKN